MGVATSRLQLVGQFLDALPEQQFDLLPALSLRAQELANTPMLNLERLTELLSPWVGCRRRCSLGFADTPDRDHRVFAASPRALRERSAHRRFEKPGEAASVAKTSARIAWSSVDVFGRNGSIVADRRVSSHL